MKCQKIVASFFAVAACSPSLACPREATYMWRLFSKDATKIKLKTDIDNPAADREVHSTATFLIPYPASAWKPKMHFPALQDPVGDIAWGKNLYLKQALGPKETRNSFTEAAAKFVIELMNEALWDKFNKSTGKNVWVPIHERKW